MFIPEMNVHNVTGSVEHTGSKYSRVCSNCGVCIVVALNTK